MSPTTIRDTQMGDRRLRRQALRLFTDRFPVLCLSPLEFARHRFDDPVPQQSRDAWSAPGRPATWSGRGRAL